MYSDHESSIDILTLRLQKNLTSIIRQNMDAKSYRKLDDDESDKS